MFSIAKGQPTLYNLIVRVYTHWNEWMEEGDALSKQLSFSIRKISNFADNLFYAVFDTVPKLPKKLLKLRNALKPEPKESPSGRLWFDPIQETVTQAQQARVVQFAPIVYEPQIQPKGNSFSNPYRFQIDWLSAMAEAGFKDLALTNMDHHALGIHNWLSKTPNNRSMEKVTLPGLTSVAYLNTNFVCPESSASWCFT